MTKTHKHRAQQIEMRIQEDLGLTEIVDEFEMSNYWQTRLSKAVLNIVQSELEIHDESKQTPYKGS